MYGSTYDQPAMTRVPDGETDYLAKAAELLALVAKANERDRDSFSNAREKTRLEVASRYADLGAIQRGQMPADMARRMYEQLSTRGA